jgi:integrase
MKPLDHTRLDLAFVPRSVPMFAALIARIDAADDLSATRKRDLISGLRRVARALGRAPEEVPADPKWLQPRLAKVMPAALGLSLKGWQNAQSDARSAMAWAGIVKRRNRHIDDLSPSWRALWAQVLASQDATLPLALCRYVHFLNGLGVAPEEVRQPHAEAYMVALEADEISKSPQTAWRSAVNAWNLAATRIDGWPQIRLALPRRQLVITRQDSDLPAGFLQDLANLMQRLAHPDPFAEDGPARALRPQTLSHYKRLLRRFTSELLEAGVPPSEIDSVAALCDPGFAERGLRAMVARRGNQTGRLIDETAALLANLAGKLGLGEDVRKRLSRLASRVAVPAQRGMIVKNRARLRALQEDRTLRRLLELPDRLFATKGRKLTPHAAALAREDALSIALLIACPVRIGNIAELHLERHLHRPGDGRVFLVLTEDDTKNGQPVEFELPADVRRMLDRHLASRAPMLCPPGTPWLFPKRCGTASLNGNNLSARLTKRIRTEVGIEMNAHLFRHMAAMVWLDANPGSYEAARRLLGHAASSHTINLYSGLEARTAVQAYGDVLARKRGRGR